MLINKVPEDDGGKGEGGGPPLGNDTHDYQTANELFELMSKNQNFDTNDSDTLTPRDLVLLYKNIDLGTKLMSSASELSRVKANQHVETVVYNGDPGSESSEDSDVYSNDDLHNVCLINKERLDLFNIPSSAENSLCHKFGDLEIQTSDSNQYDRQFLFKDPYIKDQLKNFNLLSNSKEVEASVLPASLLDYVCCKRLEDNYNFYMDNIIRYVKNTIDQLKRISNGDYLTDKAKEKWMEVEHVDDDSLANTKVLATSTSIPLHVECKVGGRKSTWDDIVHSEVDVRSLSKILEKKIVVEVPKFISGSYKLLSKCRADNLIISCKKEQNIEEAKKESRVDVVFQLKRSETGQVVSNISSIMILQSAPMVKSLTEAKPTDVPHPLLDKVMNENEEHTQEQNVTITELNVSTREDDQLQSTDEHDSGDEQKVCADETSEFNTDSCGYMYRENRRTVSFKTPRDLEYMSESDVFSNTLDEVEIYTPKEASFEVCPADLRMTMQRLSIQSALPEENTEEVSQATIVKKRSPTRIRIKSPYENQSYAMEEKKRRKLLEIREKREKKKMALAENCKITKNKYVKGATMPQAASSVTKLSITNKSFYNSIYGQSTEVDPKQSKNRNRKGDVQKEVPDIAIETVEVDQDNTAKSSPEKYNKKFINRSYYLDDTVTEMMYMKMKQSEEDKDIYSASTSGISGEFRANLNILSELIAPSDSEINVRDDEADEKKTMHLFIGPSDTETTNPDSRTKGITESLSTLNIVPLNTPKVTPKSENDKDIKKIKSSIECRKSIDKIYQLMEKMGKPRDAENKPPSKSSYGNNRSDVTGDKGSCSIQGSDSGTSLKHHLTSSNPSTFSFDKKDNQEVSGAFKVSESPINVIPKVIISSKSQIPVPKIESEKNKKERKGVVTGSPRGQENNPLKAISQLLHEFENVQRNRLKSGTEQKSAKKTPDVTTASNDGKANPRQGSFKRRSRLEQHGDTLDRHPRAAVQRDRKVKVSGGMDAVKIPYQQVPTDERYVDKNNKKKITDILDEAKEARGEAVRGPSKFTSRLNSLAQPKRSYVQAHSEEYQNRYGRNLITDRLQRLAAAPSQSVPDRTVGPVNTRNRAKRNNDAVSAVSLKLPVQSSLPIERPARTRHSTHNSPETKERVSTGIGPSYKHINVPETPEILKKKMVAVESYVKSHYGRASSSANEVHVPQKSRTPLIPSDIDMVSISSSRSPQESTEAGSKLHRIIDSMLKSTSRGLEVLAECNEPNSKSSKATDGFSLVEKLLKCDEGISIDSDFTTGTTDDEFINDSNIIDKETYQQSNAEDSNRNKKHTVESVTDLETSDHALCRPWSVGTFSKHLKIKNLRLTPEPSIQQLFLLQAGDTGSIVLNASISQNSQTDKVLDLMPILSKSNLHWSFTNIPMQITTVGYAFPEYTSARYASASLTQLLEGISTSSIKKSALVSENSVDSLPQTNNLSDEFVEELVNTFHKDIQCSKGEQLQPSIEQAPQVVVSAPVTPPDEPSYSLDFDLGRLDVIPEICASDNDSSKRIESDENVEHEEDQLKRFPCCPSTILEEKDECDFTPVNSEEVDYTTSLDILVGLLNEIKKITTCQTYITNSETHDCKELEILLNKTAEMENSNQSIVYKDLSFTALDRLRCLESNPSLYSLYLSDGEGQERSDRINSKPDTNPWYEIKCSYTSRQRPIYVDKEVSADFPRKECVNRLTDVPSIFIPIRISHSATVTTSLLGELCQSSTQSLFSYHSTYSEGSSKNLIELPQAINLTELKQSVPCCEEYQEITKTSVSKLRKQKIIFCKKYEGYKKNVKTTKMKSYCFKNSDFDPVMKMKRDILVTIYSMLVLTVFAALSFPEVLYYV